MKKMFLAFVAVFSMSVSALAATSSNTNPGTEQVADTLQNAFQKAMQETLANVEKSVRLDGYQSKIAEQANKTLQNSVEKAMQITDEEARNEEIKKAITKNLSSVSHVMDNIQYKKYLQILNSCMYKYGLLDYLR